MHSHRQEWVKSTTPYPISLSVHKLKQMLDVSVPMDPNIFNMSVSILAPNTLAKAMSQQKTIAKYYMDLEFSVCY
jgi:hypothetical protein